MAYPNGKKNCNEFAPMAMADGIEYGYIHQKKANGKRSVFVLIQIGLAFWPR